MMKTKKDPLDVFFEEEVVEDSREREKTEKPPSYISDTVRKLVLIVSVVILAVSGVIIAFNLGEEEDSPPEPERLTSKVELRSLSLPTDGFYTLNELIHERGERLTHREWDKMYEENDHLVGWLKIGDTIIDYPVVQYTDNSFYLNHNFNRRRHFDGALFVDWHTPIINTRRPDNTVIYGHNLNNGKKFRWLMNYYTMPTGSRNLDSAYNSNPTVEFSTIYCDERTTYKIFAAMFINSDSAHGEVWNYFRQRFFPTQDHFFYFMGQAMDRSVFYTDVDVMYGDEIMTLSTCYYPFRHTSDRFVVFARRVREGEDPTVDVSKAYINPSPLYFDYYYRRRGGSWDGRNWDTSKIVGFDEWYATQSFESYF
jgi:sortase B